jgi:hypothetical protein
MRKNNNWKTVHKEIHINQETLNSYGEYVDFIHLNNERITIRLIVKKEKISENGEAVHKTIGLAT